jgi:hypothetical protein
MAVFDRSAAGLERTSEEEAARLMLEIMHRQTAVTEEIRDQFAEHLELQRQILKLLMAERR